MSFSQKAIFGFDVFSVVIGSYVRTVSWFCLYTEKNINDLEENK